MYPVWTESRHVPPRRAAHHCPGGQAAGHLLTHLGALRGARVGHAGSCTAIRAQPLVAGGCASSAGRTARLGHRLSEAASALPSTASPSTPGRSTSRSSTERSGALSPRSEGWEAVMFSAGWPALTQLLWLDTARGGSAQRLDGLCWHRGCCVRLPAGGGWARAALRARLPDHGSQVSSAARVMPPR